MNEITPDRQSVIDFSDQNVRRLDREILEQEALLEIIKTEFVEQDTTQQQAQINTTLASLHAQQGKHLQRLTDATRKQGEFADEAA